MSGLIDRDLAIEAIEKYQATQDLVGRYIAVGGCIKIIRSQPSVTPQGGVNTELLNTLKYVLSAHGEQLHDAFDQAHKLIEKAESL